MSYLTIKRVEINKPSKINKSKKSNKSNTSLKQNYYKKNFIYLDKSNKQIINSKILLRINNLKIPPNYDNVLISSNKDADLQAIGYDSKNRKQYIYHPNFIAKKEALKYEKYIILGKYIKKIQNDIDKIIHKISKINYNKWPQPTSNIAIIIYLLDKCLFRIGNFNYYNKYGTIGILTLGEEHITLNKEKKTVHISFIGKKGVLNECILLDNRLYNIFKELKQSKLNKNEFLFDYKLNNYKLSINVDDIQKILNNYNSSITPKMFRTWHSNCAFIYLLKSKLELLEQLEKKQELTKKIKINILKESCNIISNKLHNTPTVLKKSYLDHLIFNMFLNDTNKLLKLIRKFKNYNNENTLIAIETIIRK